MPFEDVSLLLCQDKIGVIPCDTVLGLVGAATEASALRLCEIKQRPIEKGFIVLLPSLEWVTRVAVVTPSQLSILSSLWPNPVTVVLPKTAFFSDFITGSSSTIAVRLPGSSLVFDLLSVYKKPLLSTSVNVSSFDPVSHTDFLEASMRAALSFVISGESASVPSTLVDLTSPMPVVLRQGAFVLPSSLFGGTVSL